jgi:hypothetical protein
MLLRLLDPIAAECSNRRMHPVFDLQQLLDFTGRLEQVTPVDGTHDVIPLKRAVVNYSCLTDIEAASSQRGPRS